MQHLVQDTRIVGGEELGDVQIVHVLKVHFSDAKHIVDVNLSGS